MSKTVKRKFSIGGWRQSSPMYMANRMIACYMLQEIGVENLKLIPDEKIKELFLNVYIEQDVEGKDFEVYELDWEFVLFSATDHEISKVFDFFQPKQEASEEAQPAVETSEIKKDSNEKSKVISLEKAQGKAPKERVIIGKA